MSDVLTERLQSASSPSSQCIMILVMKDALQRRRGFDLSEGI